MSEKNEDKKGVLKARPGRLELKKTVNAGQVRQSFSHGRTKSVAVEVRRKRTFTQGASGTIEELKKQAPENSVVTSETSLKVKGSSPEKTDNEETRSPVV